jgi:hypothetical protein
MDNEVKRGRPKQGLDRVIRVRIPVEIETWLKLEANVHSSNVSEVIRRELVAARNRKQAA